MMDATNIFCDLFEVLDTYPMSANPPLLWRGPGVRRFFSKIFRAKPGIVAPGCKNNAPEASLPLRILHVIFNPCVYFFSF